MPVPTAASKIPSSSTLSPRKPQRSPPGHLSNTSRAQQTLWCGWGGWTRPSPHHSRERREWGSYPARDRSRSRSSSTLWRGATREGTRSCFGRVRWRRRGFRPRTSRPSRLRCLPMPTLRLGCETTRCSGGWRMWGCRWRPRPGMSSLLPTSSTPSPSIPRRGRGTPLSRRKCGASSSLSSASWRPRASTTARPTSPPKALRWC
mmetsp:Transcript_26912/g.64229  ORF Transcript_26912/g.64229 Transcript_26912/m.64229 type:complete len:204 (-) Transcript_26912:994-1605(-)